MSTRPLTAALRTEILLARANGTTSDVLIARYGSVGTDTIMALIEDTEAVAEVWARLGDPA
jgi:hypothetical protein